MSEVERADVDRFFRDQRLAVLGTIKSDGAPQLSPVYFAWDGKLIYLSITRTRAKYHNIRRDPRVTLCVLQDTPPYQAVTVYGDAEIEEEDILDHTLAVVHKFRPGTEMDRDAFLEELRRQQRVVVKITPSRFVR
ncbi:MAG TPA: PPOX class F420-dependent oxidoreductase [Dehalococcoidia bacterium]|nr:PPOX class F420-dependent oxidoreductase [Dehalococcoidia bacterium]